MYKADQIGMSYEPSQTIEHQGNRASIQRYLRQGFYVKVSRNGYWVLVRGARVIVTAYCGEHGTYAFDMKQAICNYYGQAAISERAAGQFYNDFRMGLLEVWVDAQGFQIKRS